LGILKKSNDKSVNPPPMTHRLTLACVVKGCDHTEVITDNGYNAIGETSVTYCANREHWAAGHMVVTNSVPIER
jgi:hypothetical protein